MVLVGQLPPNKLPPENCPPDNYPPDNCPPDNCPQTIASQTIAPRTIAPLYNKKEKKEFKSCVGHQKCAKAYMVQSLMGPSLKSSVVVAFFVHVAWRQFLTIAF